ncbi:ABC transporter permease [Eisenbergiella sp.]
MGAILYTELLKIKRASMMKAGVILVALSCVLSVIPIFARDSTVKNFALLMGNILENNCIYFSPVLTVLLGSYMMEREITDDTLKNMLTIPVSFQRLLLGKLMVLLVMVSLFGLGSGILGSLLGATLKLPGIGAGSILIWSVRIICANILIFAAVLPITVLAACTEGAMLAGTAAAFVYGFLASIDWKPMNYYPVKAVMILLRPEYGNQYDWLHYSRPIAAAAIAVVFLASFVLIKRMKPGERKNKASKVSRKKGW